MNRILLSLFLVVAACNPRMVDVPSEIATPSDSVNDDPAVPDAAVSGQPLAEPATTASLVIVGGGSVSVGTDPSHRCSLFASCEYADIALKGQNLEAVADVGHQFTGWFGDCDPAALKRQPSVCRPVKPVAGTSARVTAVFVPGCSESGWCPATVALSPAEYVVSMARTSEGFSLLGTSGAVYSVESGSPVRAQMVFSRELSIAPTGMCRTPSGTSYISASAGIVGSLVSGVPNVTPIGNVALPWNSVGCASDEAVCVAGEGDRISCRTPAGVWQALSLAAVSLPAKNRFYGVYTARNGHVFAVGTQGTVVSVIDSVVSKIAGPTKDLYAVSGQGDNNIWAVGTDALVYRWDGTRLNTVAVPPQNPPPSSTEYLIGATAFTDKDGLPALYAVGINGLIVRCKTTGCVRESAPVSARWTSLRTVAVVGTAQRMAVACGEAGQCLFKYLQ